MKFLSVCLSVAAAPVVVQTSAVKSELREISFRLNFTPGPEHSYLYYGIEKGVFEKAGLKPILLAGKGSSLSAKLVGNGNEDAGLVTADYVLMGLAKGLRLKSIATLFHQSLAVIASPASKNIRKLEDLYGRRLGVTLESTTYPQWQGLCALRMIDRAKIKEIPITPGLAGRMLAADEIDAYVGFSSNEALSLGAKGIDVNEIRFAENGIDMYGMTLTIGPKLMDDKGTVKKLRDAVLEALRLARAQPDAAVASYWKGAGVSGAAGDREKFRAFLGFVFDDNAAKLGVGYQTEDGWKTTAKTLKMLGQLEDVSGYKDAYWNDKTGS